jgi:BioD-like phosphotransacetylase family protein
MSNLLVVSTDRGEGKTAVAATLAHVAITSGRTAVALKPFGGADEIGADSAIFASLLGSDDAATEQAIPAKGLTKKSMTDTAKALKALKVDLAVVEASSELSPDNTAALADALEAKIVLVVRHTHGMTSAAVAAHTGSYSKRLAGVVLNGRGVYAGSEADALAAELNAVGTPVLAIIPDDRRLLGVTVRKLAEHLNGRLVQGAEAADGLIEHFLVGGWMMDDGTIYFGTRSNKAVIIRGDRPDLAMSALATPTRVLVLTKGLDPIEYITYEAAEEGTALLVVEQDTLATMDAVGTVVESARFDHPDKLVRMAELLAANGDPAAIAAL